MIFEVDVKQVQSLDSIGFPFAHELALRAPQPIEAFQLVVHEIEQSNKGLNFVRGMLSGIDQRDPQLLKECIKLALNSPALEKKAVSIYGAIRMTDEGMDEVIKALSSGMIAPHECAYLSYGRGMDALSPGTVIKLLDELHLRHGTDGTWTALEIITMYQLGRDQ